jgi:hypothetical protein
MKSDGNGSLCAVSWNGNASPPPKQLHALSELQNSMRNGALAGCAYTSHRCGEKFEKEKRREARTLFI